MGSPPLSSPKDAHRRPHCDSARKAIRHYQRLERQWLHKLGAAQRPSSGHGYLSCSQVHRRIELMRVRVAKARTAYKHWWYHYAWWAWMPDKWQRIGACETGYGKRPGNFQWNSGTYQGFVGFYWGSWDAYKPQGFPAEAYQATPRQQMIVAERIRGSVGYGAWGCGGA